MRGILGESSLSNAMLVITHADPDMVAGGDAQKRQKDWIEDAKKYPYMAELLSDVNYRCIFVCNPPESSMAAMETVQKEIRSACREELLRAIAQFQTIPYRIESVAKAQEHYDTKMKQLEEEKQRAETEKQKKMVEQAIEEEKKRFDEEVTRLTKEHARQMEGFKIKKKKGLFGKIGSILDDLFF